MAELKWHARTTREKLGDLIAADLLARRGESGNCDDPDDLFHDAIQTHQGRLGISDNTTDFLGFYPQVNRDKEQNTQDFLRFNVLTRYSYSIATVLCDQAILTSCCHND